MQRFIKLVGNGRKTARDMSHDEAAEAISLVMSGQATEGQVAAFMAALRIKEESSDELAAFATTIRSYCHNLEVEHRHLLDLCLPYDGRSKSLSLTPAAACIAAAGGVAVAMHGRLGPTTPPKFGLGVGDTWQALGVEVNASLETAARLLEREDVGLGFVSTAQFAPRLEGFNAMRFDYGLRSFFNNVEKLLNPFGANNGMAGVFHGPVLARVAAALAAQGYRRGLCVHGPEGSLDVLTSRQTKIVEFGNPPGTHEPRSWLIDPAEFGWRSSQSEGQHLSYPPNQPANPTDERDDEQERPGVTARQNAELTLELLNPAQPQVVHTERGRATLLSASLLLYAGGRVSTIAEGLPLATQLLQSGAALARLEKWREASQSPLDASLVVEMNHSGEASQSRFRAGSTSSRKEA